MSSYKSYFYVLSNVPERVKINSLSDLHDIGLANTYESRFYCEHSKWEVFLLPYRINPCDFQTESSEPFTRHTIIICTEFSTEDILKWLKVVEDGKYYLQYDVGR